MQKAWEEQLCIVAGSLLFLILITGPNSVVFNIVRNTDDVKYY